MVGSGANQLILSYLRHSLCSHLISYAAVLKWISNYDNPENHNHLLLALLEFVDSIIPGVTCSNRQEETLMVDAVNSLIRWLWQVYIRSVDCGEDQLLNQLANVLHKICDNDFVLGVLCLARVDNPVPMREVTTGLATFRNNKPAAVGHSLTIQRHFQTLVEVNLESLPMVKIERKCSPAIAHILQPLLVVELLNNPSNDSRILSQLMLVQSLKRFQRPQFYCEILRSCLLTLQNVCGTQREPLYCAFTFIKMPQILKQLIAGTRREVGAETDVHAELLQAIDLLLEESSLLDVLDFKCGLNTIEWLLKEFQKHGLVTDKHTEHYAAKREGVSANVLKLDPVNQTMSTVKFVIRADQPLTGILKTLNTDYNKVQEALLSMLYQVTHGNSLEFILAVATVEGKLKAVVNRLIKSNECSKQVMGETGKPAATRAALFDVTFLYLVYIVQTFSAVDLVLEERGDSFFEHWVRHSMVDRKRLKSPMTIVRACDPAKIDDLLMHLNNGTPTNLKWHEIAETIPGMLYQVLLAWENGLAAHEVKVILDNLKTKMGVYSVCAVSWLCCYLHAVNEEEHRKPLTMIQQLLAEPEDAVAVENLKERLGLTNQIIHHMQGQFQARSVAVGKTQYPGMAVVCSGPLEETFDNAWAQITEQKWLSVDVAQTLQRLYESCGAFWLVQRLVHELDKCKYVTEVDQVTDIVFSVMHVDIEATTIALIADLLPVLMAADLAHPYTTAVARLCVYVILSAVGQQEGGSGGSMKKRGRMGEGGEETNEPNMKMRKLDGGEFPDDVCGMLGSEQSVGGAGGKVTTIKEPLQSTLKEMFKRFLHNIQSDEFSPRVNFIYEFVTILVESRKCDAVSVLRLIPAGLMQSLLKIMPIANIKSGLILQMYDLSMASGRQQALSDLCVLRRNMQINVDSISL